LATAAAVLCCAGADVDVEATEVLDTVRDELADPEDAERDDEWLAELVDTDADEREKVDGSIIPEIVVAMLNASVG
jgi:hypothetical protein